MTDLTTEEYGISLPSEALGLVLQYALFHYPFALSAAVQSVLQHFAECATATFISSHIVSKHD